MTGYHRGNSTNLGGVVCQRFCLACVDPLSGRRSLIHSRQLSAVYTCVCESKLILSAKSMSSRFILLPLAVNLTHRAKISCFIFPSIGVMWN